MAVAAPAPPRLRDPVLHPIWEKVQAGERLSREDGLALFDTDDLHGVGRMADFVKSRLHGDQVFFVINRYINPTNVCVLSCSFCDFARKKGEAGAFENTIEDVLDMIKPGTREAHIVGGHHPDWPFEYFERLIEAIHDARPETQIKAFTAAEIDYFWRRWKIEPARGAHPAQEGAGCTRCPGGGAEIFSPRLQKLLHFTGKADADRWCEIHGIAHSLGIKTNATMLYGHVETLAERVDHLLRLREQQDSVGRLPHLHSPRLPDRDHQAGAAPDPAHRRPADHRGLAAAARQLPAHRGVLGDDRRGHRLPRAPLRRLRRQRHAGGREDRPHGAGGEPGGPGPRADPPDDPRRGQGRRSSATRSTTS